MKTVIFIRDGFRIVNEVESINGTMRYFYEVEEWVEEAGDWFGYDSIEYDNNAQSMASAYKSAVEVLGYLEQGIDIYED